MHKHFTTEAIVDRRKNISRSEYTRHRSATSFLVNRIIGRIACTWQPERPSRRNG